MCMPSHGDLTYLSPCKSETDWPRVNLLKIIGPCHTVSSFLNISSVVMTKWDEALGKILLVFTYGSGCASSMYQLRFDDIAWFDPLAIWKVKQFYRNAINVRPDLRMHQVYIDTWMKFDYRPHGRISFGFGYETYELMFAALPRALQLQMANSPPRATEVSHVPQARQAEAHAHDMKASWQTTFAQWRKAPWHQKKRRRGRRGKRTWLRSEQNVNQKLEHVIKQRWSDEQEYLFVPLPQVL
ncbi:Hmgcs1 [Symbiodinium sp. CCMP2592]|nr:Hmgcs1 [Symbiodinium sp. CCMP2592]